MTIDVSKLTARQRDLARMLGEGMMTKDICTRLATGEPTIKMRIRVLARLLNFTHRAQFAVFAEHGDPVDTSRLPAATAKVVDLLCQGVGTGGIAARMGLSPATVRGYIKRARVMLGLDGTTRAGFVAAVSRSPRVRTGFVCVVPGTVFATAEEAERHAPPGTIATAAVTWMGAAP